MVRIPLVALLALAVLAGSARADNGGTALSAPGGAGGATPTAIPRTPKPQAKPKGPQRPKAKPRPKTRPRPRGVAVLVRFARFPVLGSHGFGGPDARFGALRPGHTHQGQDVVAAAGTPVVAPREGVVTHRADQPRGAGLYLVIHSDDGRDYVFMHLLPGSTRVVEGQRVRTGQGIGAVGSTGDTTGPHLHFEIWVGGWKTPGGHPIDPLPDLLRWDARF